MGVGIPCRILRIGECRAAGGFGGGHRPLFEVTAASTRTDVYELFDELDELDELDEREKREKT